jgi:L-alanine-DL-glutamate epimerase-like enolase superfamily enzyme
MDPSTKKLDFTYQTREDGISSQHTINPHRIGSLPPNQSDQKPQKEKPTVKITDVKTASIKGNFEWVLVRVYTDEGLSGLGECYWGAGVETVVHSMKRLLLGEDPHNVDWLYQRMIRGMSGAGSTGGTVVAAISGIELALWDLKGKALGTPIYNLLGGRYRTRIRVYADCGQGDQPIPESWAERARQAVAKGFTAIKFDIDNTDPKRFGDPYHVGTGPRGGWMQGQQRPISRDVIQLAHELESFRLMWLEDPTPPDNVEALKRATDRSPVPICSGENHYTRHGLRQMIVTQAVDIVQPDIPRVGGLLEAKKIADLADIYYIPLAAHNVSSPIGTMAACHTCASMRNFLILEFHAQDVPWWDDLVIGDQPMIQDGYITLPDEPGLGIELNEDVARAHLGPSTTFFE